MLDSNTILDLTLVIIKQFSYAAAAAQHIRTAEEYSEGLLEMFMMVACLKIVLFLSFFLQKSSKSNFDFITIIRPTLCCNNLQVSNIYTAMAVAEYCIKA